MLQTNDSISRKAKEGVRISYDIHEYFQYAFTDSSCNVVSGRRVEVLRRENYSGKKLPQNLVTDWTLVPFARAVE
jgi:hypothetical protein